MANKQKRDKQTVQYSYPNLLAIFIWTQLVYSQFTAFWFHFSLNIELSANTM